MLRQLLHLKITHKTSIGFAVVTILVIGLVAFNLLGLSRMKSDFSEYRSQARQSLFASEIFAGLSQVRVDVLKYRLEQDDAIKTKIVQNLNQIQMLKENVEQLSNQDYKKDVLALLSKIQSYHQLFDQSVVATEQEKKLAQAMQFKQQVIEKNLKQLVKNSFDQKQYQATLLETDILQSYLVGQNATMEFILSQEPQYVDVALASFKNATDKIDLLSPMLAGKQNALILQALKEDIVQYEQDFKELQKAVLQIQDLYVNGMGGIGKEIFAQANQMIQSAAEHQNKLGPETVARMQQTSAVGAIVGAVIVCVSGLLAVLISRFLSHNFDLIIRQTSRLAAGDKEFTIEGVYRKDEIGAVGRSLQVFKDSMLEREQLAEQARRKQEIENQRAERMKQSVAKFENVIASVLATLAKSSRDLSFISGDINEKMTFTGQQGASVAAAAVEATSNVQTVAAAAEEMSASILEISQNVNDTAETSNVCANTAHKTTQNLEILQHAVSEIDSVVQSISDVAAQTNLLALNATIEAARAGEAGKGFAVVASEVKTLASDTHKMTEEISSKVLDIKMSAEETIASVQQIINEIGSVESKTTGIAGAIEEQTASTAEISRNVQEAASGTAQVSANIDAIQNVIQEALQTTASLKEASAALEHQSGELKLSVDSFLSEVAS